MNTRILIVDDEPKIAESLNYTFEKEGFEVDIASDGLEALDKFKSFMPDLIVLDLMMPKLNGIDVCRVIRKESMVPIVMLTARTEEVDKILGLELGADDYITKPFSIRELVTRIRVILRRTTGTPVIPEQTTIHYGDFVIDIPRRFLSVKGQNITLPLKQFEIIRALISARGVVVKREDLIKEVWGDISNYDSGSLDVHIRWLREKIEPNPSKPIYIKTVRGVGHRISDVSEEDTTQDLEYNGSEA